jgi:hypothetical protein
MTRLPRATLASILFLGLALRVAYFVHALRTPGFVWQDPDGYVTQALRLTAHGWHWTFQAVTYRINDQIHALPPMYPVFLSVFALFPRFPLTAQVAQLLLSVVAIGLVFALGRSVHSVRTGLIAAAAYAVWVPNINNVWSTSQETLYVPLILAAFLLLLRAIERDDGWVRFVVAGLAFSVAALTRSMPLFFALPAAGAHVALAADRSRATLQAAAFLAGFVLLTAPYSAALSRYFGQVTVIDTHGSIHLDSESESGVLAPGLGETAGGLWRAVSTRPGAYLAESLARARSLFHVNGGRILQIYVVADTRLRAIAWKAAVLAGSDVLLVVATILAAPGAALCRRPRLVVFLLIWIAINVGIASAGGFGGARLRAPFEPLLLVLAAVVCAGEWRRPRLPVLGLALVTSAVAALAVLPQLPASLRAWPDYGVKWPSIFTRHEGDVVGTAGLSVPAYAGTATLDAVPTGDIPVLLHVVVAGVPDQILQLAPGQITSIRARWPSLGLAFVELTASGPSGAREAVRVVVPGR